MSERTDHAAEARKRVQWVNEWQEREGDIPETHLADALVAQAHATLALVEQQRIANLIALANTSGTDVLSPCEQAAWSALGDPDSGPLLPDIAAALGIEVAS